MVFMLIINYLNYFFQDNIKIIENQHFSYNYILIFCSLLFVSYKNILTYFESFVKL